MASYQDIDSRLRTVEELLTFIATSMRMRGVVSNGLVGPDGQPQGRTIDGSMLDFYHMSKNLDVVKQSDLAEETQVNG